jgi:glycosyltransferase involved in cell wall biosynthesis
MRILGIGNARSVIFLRWAWEARKAGHSVVLVSDRFSADDDELEGLETFDIRKLDRLTRIRGVRRLRLHGALTQFAHSLDIDLVHGHYLLPYGYWASLIEGLPRVVSPWGTDILIDADRRRRDQRRTRHAISTADWLVVNSNASRAKALEFGADPERIDQIIWYADLGRFGSAHYDPGLRLRLGWPRDALIVLSLRNFRPDTNIDVVVRAFARLSSKQPRARLVLAARGGPLRGEIEALVDRLELRPLVSFVTALEPELPALVASADVLVSMTTSDSTPSSLLEAMASGLPAVCADAASVEQWLDSGRGGLIVPQRDDHALATAMGELLADPERRRRYGEHNKTVIGARFVAPGPQLDRLYRFLTQSETPQGNRPPIADTARSLP